MDWNDYQLVLHVAMNGSLRGAGTDLGLNHTTVSRRLATLEHRLGGPVFERVVGGYRPTALGGRILAVAEDMEAAAATLDRRNKATEEALTGPVTLSVPEVLGQFLLAPHFAEFARLYPKIVLTVMSSTRFADLDRSEADVVVRGTDDPPSHLVGRRLFPFALSYYAAADYLDRVPPEERFWIGTQASADKPKWLAQSPFPDAPIRMTMNDHGLRQRMAIDGQGMIVTACYVADPEPLLSRLPGAGLLPMQDLWVLTHPDLRHSPRIRVLMNFLAARITDHQALISGEKPAAGRT